MSQLEFQKDYYEILGADENVSARELERLYKRMAARRHPDRGGNEDDMKALNEAYRVLKDQQSRREYDAKRAKTKEVNFVPVSSPPAQEVGLLGHGLSALLCLLIGLFLLFLVRFQWIWFLWPLAILAMFVIFFGIMMARSTMRAFNASLPATNPVRNHTRLQEVAFWLAVICGCYGIYVLLIALQ